MTTDIGHDVTSIYVCVINGQDERINYARLRAYEQWNQVVSVIIVAHLKVDKYCVTAG